MDIKSFKSAEMPRDVLFFLEVKGNNHKYYHHYTNIDSLIKMIHSKYFLLTRGNSVNINDQHEYRAKGSAELWNKTYLASFAYGDSENMAMWGLYGLPWEEAIRISIPQKAMKKWIAGISDVFSARFINGNLQTEQLRVPFRARLSDIVYIDGKQDSESSKLYWNGESVSLKDRPLLKGIDLEPQMTGFIKNDAWKYENEVRVHIQLQKETDEERIAIKLTDEVVSSMIITAGPYFKGNLEEKIAEKVPFVLNNFQFEESGFKNLVKYRSLCTMCQHETFVRK